jgi:hypothetical protein
MLQFFDEALEMTGYLRIAVWVFPLLIVVLGASVFLFGLIFTRIHPVWVAILILALSATLVTASSFAFYRQRMEALDGEIVEFDDDFEDYFHALRDRGPISHRKARRYWRATKTLERWPSVTSYRAEPRNTNSKSKDIINTIRGSDDKYSRAGLAEINERLHQLYIKLGPPGE